MPRKERLMAQESGFDFFGFGGKLGSESEVREKFWRTAKKAARQIPFMEDVVAAYYCAMDKNTPLRAKGILVAALGYFVLPLDLIPDFIFGLGFTDDIAVRTAAITAVIAIKNWTMSMTSTPHRPEWAAKRTLSTPQKSSVSQGGRPKRMLAILQAARQTLARIMQLKNSPR